MTTVEPAYEVTNQAPQLGDDALAEARELIGVELRREEHQWNTSAARDNVRHFVYGIGDSNPLYVDPAYGASTKWGTAIAPGTFLYTVDTTVVAPRLRGIQWIYMGTEWNWYREIRVGEEITTRVKLVDAETKSGNFAKNFLIQRGLCEFIGVDGEVFATALASTARIPRSKAQGGLSYEPREPQKYSAEEIASIEEQSLRQVPRGGTPRMWESVSEGDLIESTVKGPLNVIDMICWYSTGHPYYAHERDVVHRRRHPADAYTNPDTGADVHPARGHVEGYMAQEVGMPGVYDVGLQRIGWLEQAVTLWMGDVAFIRSLKAKIRRPNVVGDVTRIHGRVTSLTRGPDPEYRGSVALDGIVDLEIWAENQRGERTAEAMVRLLLPVEGQA